MDSPSPVVLDKFWVSTNRIALCAEKDTDFPFVLINTCDTPDECTKQHTKTHALLNHAYAGISKSRAIPCVLRQMMVDELSVVYGCPDTQKGLGGVPVIMGHSDKELLLLSACKQAGRFHHECGTSQLTCVSGSVDIKRCDLFLTFPSAIDNHRDDLLLETAFGQVEEDYAVEDEELELPILRLDFRNQTDLTVIWTLCPTSTVPKLTAVVVATPYFTNEHHNAITRKSDGYVFRVGGKGKRVQVKPADIYTRDLQDHTRSTQASMIVISQL